MEQIIIDLSNENGENGVKSGENSNEKAGGCEEVSTSSSENSKTSLAECHLCYGSFATIEMFMNHMESYHGYKDLMKCSFCDLVFGNNNSLEFHIKTDHPVNWDPSVLSQNHSCKVCGEKFNSVDVLAAHELVHTEPKKCLENQKVSNEFKKLNCYFCMKSFLSEKALFWHTERKHCSFGSKIVKRDCAHFNSEPYIPNNPSINAASFHSPMETVINMVFDKNQTEKLLRDFSKFNYEPYPEITPPNCNSNSDFVPTNSVMNFTFAENKNENVTSGSTDFNYEPNTVNDPSTNISSFDSVPTNLVINNSCAENKSEEVTRDSGNFCNEPYTAAFQSTNISSLNLPPSNSVMNNTCAENKNENVVKDIGNFLYEPNVSVSPSSGFNFNLPVINSVMNNIYAENRNENVIRDIGDFHYEPYSFTNTCNFDPASINSVVNNMYAENKNENLISGSGYLHPDFNTTFNSSARKSSFDLLPTNFVVNNTHAENKNEKPGRDSGGFDYGPYTVAVPFANTSDFNLPTINSGVINIFSESKNEKVKRNNDFRFKPYAAVSPSTNTSSLDLPPSDSVVNSPSAENKTEKQIKCGVCSETFDWFYQYSKHIEYHFDVKHYFCSVCPAKFSFLYNFKLHWFDHKSDCCKCQYCGLPVKSKKSLKSHEWKHKCFLEQSAKNDYLTWASQNEVRIMHSNSEFKSNNQTSSGVYSSENGVNKELQNSEHSIADTNLCAMTNSYSDQNVPHSWDENDSIRELIKPINMINCQVCGERFALDFHAAKHVETHDVKKPFSCSSCDKSFALKVSRKAHVLLSHFTGLLYYCTICGKPFKNKVVKHLKSSCFSMYLEQQLNLSESSRNLDPESMIKSFCVENKVQPCTPSSTCFAEHFSCNICQKLFIYERQLLYHVLLDHTSDHFPFSAEVEKEVPSQIQESSDAETPIRSVSLEVPGCDNNS